MLTSLVAIKDSVLFEISKFVCSITDLLLVCLCCVGYVNSVERHTLNLCIKHICLPFNCDFDVSNKG